MYRNSSLDDMMSGFTVANNVFNNCSRALLLGGGRENIFANNSVDGGDIAAPQNGIHFDNRGEGWDAKGCAPGGNDESPRFGSSLRPYLMKATDLPRQARDTHEVKLKQTAAFRRDQL